jgi:hypothetical protein
MLKPRRDPSRAERVELIASPARRKESARTLWVFDERAVKRARDAAE